MQSAPNSDAELGVEAVAGLAVELVAEAEHRLLLGADHAHEHGAVPGWVRSSSRSRSDPVVVEHARLTFSVSGGCRRGSARGG